MIDLTSKTFHKNIVNYYFLVKFIQDEVIKIVPEIPTVMNKTDGMLYINYSLLSIIIYSK